MKGTGARVVAVTGTVLLAWVSYILANEPKGKGSLSFLLRQLLKGSGGRLTPIVWRSTARNSLRSYGLVR